VQSSLELVFLPGFFFQSESILACSYNFWASEALLCFYLFLYTLFCNLLSFFLNNKIISIIIFLLHLVLFHAPFVMLDSEKFGCVLANTYLFVE